MTTNLTSFTKMTVGSTGHLLIDETLVNRCATALVIALVIWLLSKAWQNFRG